MNIPKPLGEYFYLGDCFWTWGEYFSTCGWIFFNLWVTIFQFVGEYLSTYGRIFQLVGEYFMLLLELPAASYSRPPFKRLPTNFLLNISNFHIWFSNGRFKWMPENFRFNKLAKLKRCASRVKVRVKKVWAELTSPRDQLSHQISMLMSGFLAWTILSNLCLSLRPMCIVIWKSIWDLKEVWRSGHFFIIDGLAFS